jgi:fluoride exporter
MQGEALRDAVAVAAGSGLGALTRYLVSLGTMATLGAAVPWATLTVNVAGSLLIGVFATLLAPGGRLAGHLPARAFLMVGFCGGLTTFSVFSLETLELALAGRTGTAAFTVGASLALWIPAAWVGYELAVRLVQRPPKR